ncbi:MAG: Ni/Fe-hydrogenase, b-type cytochrome subunit [Acidobacteriia bacterium]|nr:Ni/Fe-hydrogenase, b-type cytochrome subunit [Terriglobia bacterium]
MTEMHGGSRQISGPYQLAPGRTRIYVWEKPVRFAHWLLVLSLVVLSVTGYYIYNPFVISRGRAAYVMGTARFIHLVAAWAFIAAILVRFYWFFRGNRWARINQFIPTRRERWQDAVETVKYYMFRRWNPTPRIGHNALAGATYTLIFGIAVIEIITGLALYNNVVHSKCLGLLVGWVPRLADIQWLREIHFLVMFALWFFFIHHMYSVLLAASEEKNGCVEGMVSGYKFVTQADLQREFGTRPGGEKSEPVRAVRQTPAAGKVSG